MIHTKTKIYIHISWAVHNSMHKLQPHVQDQVTNILTSKATSLSLSLKAINVQSDHIHILLELPPKLSLALIVQKLKGYSSNWINKQHLFNTHFHWKRGYDAYSISAAHTDNLITLFKNQHKYHLKKTYVQECQSWRKKYRIV